MTQVQVRELNQDTAGVLARVKRGEHVDITERGVVIARIVPAEPSPFSKLIASGALHPATLSGPVTPPPGPVRVDADAGSQLRADRDSERY
jgi:prevent-host-death family protein